MWRIRKTTLKSIIFRHFHLTNMCAQQKSIGYLFKPILKLGIDCYYNFLKKLMRKLIKRYKIHYLFLQTWFVFIKEKNVSNKLDIVNWKSYTSISKKNHKLQA